jgi:hypothetical protein
MSQRAMVVVCLVLAACGGVVEAPCPAPPALLPIDAGTFADDAQDDAPADAGCIMSAPDVCVSDVVPHEPPPACLVIHAPCELDGGARCCADLVCTSASICEARP